MKQMYQIWMLALCLLGSTAYGQKIDEALMERDLEVAENILATLISSKKSKHGVWGHSRNVEGSYLENYGVVFRLSDRFIVSNFSLSGAPSDDFDDTEVLIIEGETTRKGVGGKAQATMDDLKSTVIEFLVDYGNLIHQLKPADKIMVKTDQSKGRGSFTILAGGQKQPRKSSLRAEVTKSDLDAYEAGNLTRAQIEEKVVISESVVDVSLEPQLEVFASMLKRLYEVDLSDTYYMSNRPYYERMSDFGVTYYVKVYSSRVHDDDRYTLPTIDRKDVSKEEREKIVEEMYPKFVDSMKEHVLEYGHVLKTLKPEEMVVLQIKLTSCDCDIPVEIEMSTKKSTIEDYRSGKKGKSQAMADVAVKKLR